MYDYFIGNVTDLNPAEITLECNCIGYRIMISLQTYTAINDHGAENVKIYLYHLVREDDEAFYGFFDKDERALFMLLISVSGVGPNTARMMLSSLTAEELRNAIIAGDVNKIKSIKGIGLKTAQRLIIDLKDKVVKGGGSAGTIPTLMPDNQARSEAAAALLMLGFTKPAIEKALDKICREYPQATLENMIKLSLKLM